MYEGEGEGLILAEAPQWRALRSVGLIAREDNRVYIDKSKKKRDRAESLKGERKVATPTEVTRQEIGKIFLLRGRPKDARCADEPVL